MMLCLTRANRVQRPALVRSLMQPRWAIASDTIPIATDARW